MNVPDQQKQFRVVGTRPVRPDGVEKVTGKAVYGPDFKAANMLFGAILRSPHPHARIRSIDTAKAEAIPGVKAIVTGADFQTLEDLVMKIGESAGNIADISRNCMAQDKVVYEGHALAAVAATSQAIADEAVKALEVDFEVLPHVIGIEEAMRDDAPLVKEDQFTQGLVETPDKPSNISAVVQLAKGDVDAALAGAAATVSARYTMPPVHQGYIEPHACVASWKADGKLDVWCSSQGAFGMRSLTAAIMAMERGKVRVMPLEIGGGFGGKTKVYLEPVTAMLSKKAGQPVRLTMSRAEVFRATGPAPGAIIDIELGADNDGMLVAAKLDFAYSAGASGGMDVHSGMGSSVGHYKIANFDIRGREVLSNMPSHAAYRAPGAPQVNFAVESAVNDLAAKLGIDPLEMRLKNVVEPGDPTLNGTPNGEIGYAECLEAAKAHPHYSAPLGPNQGRAVAAGYWGNYGGPSTAAVAVAEDGSVLVIEGNPDIGGSRASMAIMAAETLGVDYDDITVTIADTNSIGFSFLTGGSRTTFATGKAVVDACNLLIEDLRGRAAKMWGCEIADVEWADGKATCTGGDKAGESLSLPEIAGKYGTTGGPISAEASIDAMGWLPGFGVHICDIEVDPETGHSSVKRYTAVQDVGTAIHPDYVEGQMQGGAVQGIGWALNEAYIYGEDGKLDNPGFLDYRMPVASDLPMIDTVMIEKPNPNHPYGVKGVGEVPIVPPLAAVGCAIAAATGKPMRNLPLTPDRVYFAMQDEG